jgi:hypothetical protein
MKPGILPSLNVGLLLTFAVIDAASAHDAADDLRMCVHEADDARRLQCYDAAMGRNSDSGAVARSSPAAPAATAPLSAEERFGLNDAQARAKQNVEEPPALERLTATVSGITRQAEGELVMTLSNGQVWAQKQANSFEVRIGERVTIKSAALGSFLMSNASGRSTRVARIR